MDLDAWDSKVTNDKRQESNSINMTDKRFFWNFLTLVNVSCFGENDDGVVDIIDEVGEDVAGDNQSETDETVARNSPRCGDCRLEVFQDITYAIRARRVG